MCNDFRKRRGWCFEAVRIFHWNYMPCDHKVGNTNMVFVVIVDRKWDLRMYLNNQINLTTIYDV